MKPYYASGDTETAAKEILEVIRQQKSITLSTNGIPGAWRRNLEIYYKNSNEGALAFSGEQGELLKLGVPQARSLVRQSISLVCKQRLDFKAIMKSTNYNSVASGAIADALASQLVRQQKLNKKRELHTERAYIFGQSFFHVSWDMNAGRIIDEVTRQKAGDVKFELVHPMFVYYDRRAHDWDELNAVTIAKRYNRFDLIAEHPELEEYILKLPKFASEFDRYLVTPNNMDFDSKTSEDSVLVYMFYHKPTSAMPEGRLLILSDERCVFYDGANPYECIPVVPCMPELMNDSLAGYPKFCDLSGLQEMLDHNFSVVASNQSAFGVQAVMSPRGSEFSVNELGGLKHIQYTPVDGAKPEALSLAKTAPEIINSIEMYRNHMSEISNINGALRGEPPSGVTAGNALATLTANSVEFFNSLTAAIHESIEEAVTLAIKFYYMFGAEQQLVTMVDGNVSYVKAFKSQDLAEFDKVEIQLTNPLMNTLSGRLQVANDLLAQGLITSMGDYFRILEGAPPKVAYNEQLDEAYLIQRENDDLMAGIDCPVLFHDNHQEHIAKHMNLLRNPDIRRNGAAIQLILGHMEQHEQLAMANGMQPNTQQQPNPEPGQPQQSLPPAAPNAQQPTAMPAEPAEAPVSL